MKHTAKILLTLSLIVLTAILFFLGYYLFITKDSKLDAKKLTLSLQDVQIYDENDTLIHYEELGSIVADIRFEDFPEHLTNAFIAVEDKNFYEHNGFDYLRILKATVKNVTSLSFKEGASTISQQLIKNTHLTGEKTINRKLREFKLTRQLEKAYSKPQILELYLNSIYFGHNNFGIARAARFYFDKGVQELTPAESATLAALVKSPNRYSPFKNADLCLSRRNFVLKLMKEQNFINSSQYQEQIKTPLPLTATKKEGTDSYFSYILEELEEIYPHTKLSELNSLKIYTHLDQALQKQLNEIKTSTDCTVLISDNQSHSLKALYTTCGLIKRLPASTIKPLLVYAPAIEENFLSPATPILDEEINFNGYTPSNYGGKFHGYVSARYALAHSINVPAVKILNEIDCKTGTAYLEKMGLCVSEEDKTLALALGGIKEGFTLKQLTDAYTTFANEGYYHPTCAIRKIVNEKGKVVYRQIDRAKKVFSHATCALINDMLQTAVKEGTAKKLKSLPYPLCAKTGTGGTAAGNRDAYTIAYTNDHTVGVWLGNKDNSPVEATGGGLPADLALSALKMLYRAKAPAPFPACEQVEEVAIDKQSYEINHVIERADSLAPPLSTQKELFKEDNLPKAQSTRFSQPNIEKPTIFIKNGAICIQLCQTKYYNYLIKRTDGDSINVIYQGKYQELITDNSAERGRLYTYSVTPYYLDRTGKEIVLPSVILPQTQSAPDEWWN